MEKMSSIIGVIQHYQRSIEKSAHDEARLLHCIEKLYKLPITVEHLQQTGIGKTVNSLRKYDREVGVAAKALVAKWKAMVAAEEEIPDENPSKESCESDDPPDDHYSESHNGTHNGQGTKHKDGDRNGTETDLNRKEKHSHRDKSKQDQQKRHSQDIAKNQERLTKGSSKCSSTKQRIDRIESRKIDTDRHHIIDRRKEDKLKEPKEIKMEIKKEMKKEIKKEIIKDIEKEIMKEIKREIKKEIKEEPMPPPASNETPPYNSDENPYENDADVMDDDDEDEEKLVIDINSKEKLEESSAKSSHRNSSRSHHRTSKTGSSKEHHSRGKHRTDDSVKRDSNKKSSSLSSSSSHKEHRSDKTSDSGDRHRPKSDHQKEVAKKSHRSGKRNDDNDESAKSKSKDSERKDTNSVSCKIRNRNESNSKSGGSSNNKSSKRKYDSAYNSNSELDSEQSSPKKKKSSAQVIGNGIDSSTGGFSFEEALGMISGPLAPPATSSKSKLKSPKVNGTTATVTSRQQPDYAVAASSSSSSRSKTPPLLTSKIKLEPLDPKLSFDLPSISNNYKPMPLNPTVMDCVFASGGSNKPQPPKRTMTDDEALQSGIQSKTLRTKIYSGLRTGTLLQVDTLFKLCIRVLQKNIDGLEYTGGVPYDVLKDVLERATPEQLRNFELYNPYLRDDTDELWEKHCQRRYKTKKRNEDEIESWRDMYERCKKEEDERFTNITRNINDQQKQIAIPIRRTQLAYIDAAVKPPRNILRKQEQFGTKGKMSATPAARVEALSKIAPTALKAGDSKLRIIGESRDLAQASAPARPKKAPLMQKMMQLMKCRYKR